MQLIENELGWWGVRLDDGSWLEEGESDIIIAFRLGKPTALGCRYTKETAIRMAKRYREQQQRRVASNKIRQVIDLGD